MHVPTRQPTPFLQILSCQSNQSSLGNSSLPQRIMRQTKLLFAPRVVVVLNVKCMGEIRRGLISVLYSLIVKNPLESPLQMSQRPLRKRWLVPPATVSQWSIFCRTSVCNISLSSTTFSLEPPRLLWPRSVTRRNCWSEVQILVE